MVAMDGATAPKKKKDARPPKIYANTERNLERSAERLARWVLRADVSAEQVAKARASIYALRLRLDLAGLAFARERWLKEIEIEERLEELEAHLKGRDHGYP